MTITQILMLWITCSVFNVYLIGRLSNDSNVRHAASALFVQTLIAPFATFVLSIVWLYKLGADA